MRAIIIPASGKAPDINDTGERRQRFTVSILLLHPNEGVFRLVLRAGDIPRLDVSRFVELARGHSNIRREFLRIGEERGWG